MRLSQSRICTLAILAFLVANGAGCSLVGKVRAKNELNEAAKSYKEGHFEDAEQHAKRALSLDPTNRTALIFVARIIHQQYKPGVDSPENMQRGRDAIEAYKQVLQNDPKNDEAYKAISVLYSAVKDENNLRAWITARATDATQTNERRAEAYAILAGKDWDCSFKITEQSDGPKNYYVELQGPDGAGPTILVLRTPDQKICKNRLHIDVNATDRSQDEEVERILALGATRADIGQGEQSWVVLADPEGNEFCVLQSRVEPHRT